MKEKLIEVVKAIAPLMILVCTLQFTTLGAPAASFLQFLTGPAMPIFGLMLFFIGIDLGILPMGRFIGAELPQKNSLPVIIAVVFAMGFATTIAEPGVLVLSKQVDHLSGGTISGNAVLYTTAGGVGILISVSMLRVFFRLKMVHLLTAFYGLIIILSFIAPQEFTSLAYDAGSVSMGALTSPVIIALALGFSSVLAGRSTVADGFGFIGFASIGPIIAVLLIGLLFR